MVQIGLIENLHIFKDLESDELEKLLELCSVKDYQIGDSLFLEGDKATDMWIVLDGSVELRFEMPNASVTTNENTLSSHHKDIPESQVFGWSCFTAPYMMNTWIFKQRSRMGQKTAPKWRIGPIALTSKPQKIC